MKIINIEQLKTKKSLNEIKEEFEKLYKSNLNQIKNMNKLCYAFPINLQSILCLLIAYTYKIPITTITALYQLYANDLIVIAMTILNSKNIDNIFLEDSKLLLAKLNRKNVILSDNMECFFNILKHNIYDNKIYIPSDLW